MKKLNFFTPKRHSANDSIFPFHQLLTLLLFFIGTAQLTAQVSIAPPESAEHSFCGVVHDDRNMEEDQAYLDFLAEGRVDEVCTVRLMVVFDLDHYPEGETRESIAQRVVQQVSLTNEILANSEVDNLIIQLAGVEEIDHPSLNFAQSSANLVDDAKDDTQTNDGDDVLGQLNDLRELKKADIVVYFLPQTSAITDNPIGRLGSAIVVGASNAQEAVAVLFDSSFSLDFLTFPHEVGHIFGAGHQDASGTFARAFRITKGWFKRDRITVVHTRSLDQNRKLIHHYSNPDVNYKGDATGTSVHDNARKIRNRACMVSEFTQNPGFPDYHITAVNAPIDACGGDVVTVSVETSQTTVLYSWSSKVGNGPYVPHPSTGPSANFTMPNSGLLTIRIVVENANGDTAEDGASIMVWHPNAPESPCNDGGGEGRLANPNSLPISIYPNPTADALMLNLNQPKVANITIQFFNSNGQMIRSFENQTIQGNAPFTMDLSSLAAGIYFMQIIDQQTGASFIERIAKQ